MQRYFIIYILLAFVLYTCKAKNDIDNLSLMDNSISLDSYEGSYAPGNIVNPNLTLDLSKNILVINDDTTSLVHNKLNVLDSINEEFYSWKIIRMKTNKLIYENSKIDEILIIQKRSSHKN